MPRPKTSKTIALEIEKSFKANMALLEESMGGLPKNSKAYLERLLAKAKLQQQYREERASRGLDPQDLGTLTKVRYVFSALIDSETPVVSAKRQAWEDDLDKEFPSSAPIASSTALPEPKSKKRTN